MLKKILAFTVIISSFYAFSTEASAVSHSWYIKRNGNQTPLFSCDSKTVDENEGYYIDKNAAENGEKVLYLTFDAGYENGNISKILDTLKAKSVPAAFFVLDNLILKNADLVKRMTAEGHHVCNHTKNHKDLSEASFDQISNDLTDLEKLYEEKTGKELSKYFRFPEGKYSESALKCVAKLGYKTVFWSFAYDDWDNVRQPAPDKAIKKILENTHDGAVILLHPTSSTNAAILPVLIDQWRAMGYRFGTLDDLTK